MSGEVPYWGANGVVDHVNRHLFYEELVLLGEDGAPFFDLAKDVAFHVTGPVWVNNHMHVLRPRRLIDPRFLTYALNAVDYGRFVTGSTRNKLTQADMLGIDLRLPPLEEQRRIANYLDAETTRLDAIIDKNRRLEILVVERMDVWLSAEFERFASQSGLVKVRRIVRGLRQGWSPQCEDRIPSGDEWSVLKAGAVNGGRFRPSECKALPPGVVPRSEFLIRPGDLLVNRANGSLDNLGSAAVVPDYVPARVLLCDKIYRIDCSSSDIDIRWLATMLGAARSRDVIRLSASGAEGMANSLPSSVILDIEVPMMLPTDQSEFACEWDGLRSDGDEVTGALLRSIALLTERRQALITAAVTGQFDVSSAA